MTKQCSVAGCDRTHKARGFCHKHYDQQYALGMDTDHTRGCGIAARKSVVQIVRGRRLDLWLRYERLCTPDQIERLMQQRWRYGSYRPSYFQDSIPLPGDNAAQAHETIAA